MRELDGIRILGPADGAVRSGSGSSLRELISAVDTGGRWALGEVIADADDEIGTHLHPGEPEAIIVLEGRLELHGSTGVIDVSAGDVLFIPPDTEHGLRTPTGGRWLAVWPVAPRVAGPRYQTK